MKRFLLSAAGLLLFAAAPATLAAPALGMYTKAPFTKAQDAAGAKLYKADCAMCHGTKLNNGGAPKLAGDAFLAKWATNSLDDFHYIMSTTMPQTNPGSLKPEEYIALVAYVLEQNGAKPGKTALTAADLKKYNFKK